MGLRFFRRFQVFPGVTLNVSRSGVSVSLGPRGAKVTFGPTGTRATVGLPGSGLFYTTMIDGQGDRQPTASRRTTEDQALVAAHDELLAGDEDAALRSFEDLARVPDAAFVAGVLLLRADGSAVDAERHLRKARAARTLGRRLGSLGADVHLEIPIDDTTTAALRPDHRGATLALAEALQRQGRLDDAIALVRGELRRAPGDVLLQASLEDLAEAG